MFYAIESNDLDAYVKLRKTALEFLKQENNKSAYFDEITYH